MSVKNRLIFHFPGPINTTQDGASRIRPVKMLQAFKEAGYEVDVVAGNIRDRREAIKQVKAKVDSGVRYDFLYSESSTMPTALTDPHHLPLAPFLDFLFLQWFKNKVGPVGLFYRDVYWQFPDYRVEIGLLKSLIGRAFYLWDFFWYKKALSHLFLPNMKMRDRLPSALKHLESSALPAGCEKLIVTERSKSKSDSLSLFYVGGVKPPFYDLSPLLQIARRLNGFISLTLCCREREWCEVKNFYEPLLSNNVLIEHKDNSEVSNLFRKADVFVLFREQHPYWSFGAPYKIYEAMSYGVPIICRSNEGISEFIESEKLGWIVDSPSDLEALLVQLAVKLELLSEVRLNIVKAIGRNTWAARVEQVRRVLKESES